MLVLSFDNLIGEFMTLLNVLKCSRNWSHLSVRVKGLCSALILIMLD